MFTENALVTLIGEAVFARCLSAIKAERTRASKVLAAPKREPFRGDKKQFIDDLEQALYASKIMSYTQGFMLMRDTAKEQGWKLNYAGIARMWRGGCIIKVFTTSSVVKLTYNIALSVCLPQRHLRGF